MKTNKVIIFFLIGLFLGSTAVFIFFEVSGAHQTLSDRIDYIIKNPKPGYHKIIPLEVFQQETEFSCGGSIIKSLLNSIQSLSNRTEDNINKALKTGFGEKKSGTHPENMVQFLKNENLEVISGKNPDMKLIYHYIDQDIPVIVLDSTWGAHWRMIIGYDFNADYAKWENNDLFIADPEHRTVEPIVDNERGIVMENESRFFYEWYENKIFEKERKGFYIVAYPKGKKVKPFFSNN